MLWTDFHNNEMKQPYFKDLQSFTNYEYDNYICYPKKENIYKAFKTINDFNDIEVVIIGQDPYTTKGLAMSLSFSVPNDQKRPVSLRNILNEVKRENYNSSGNNDLTRWANQNVLLLNMILSVRENKSLSHKKAGWLTYTKHVLSEINNNTNPTVFIFWGNEAQKYIPLINNPIHKILKATHPAARNGKFKNCNNFKDCNDFLAANKRKTINW